MDLNQRPPAEQGSGTFERTSSNPQLYWWSLILLFELRAGKREGIRQPVIRLHDCLSLTIGLALGFLLHEGNEVFDQAGRFRSVSRYRL
jgi:hypothetical protein